MKTGTFLIHELAKRWSEAGPKEDIETELWRAFWKRELSFIFRSPNTLHSHFEGESRDGKVEPRRRIPSDEFRTIPADELLKMFSAFLARGRNKTDDLAALREEALALTSAELRQRAERHGKQVGVDDFYTTYIDHAAVEETALLEWCHAKGITSPLFWRDAKWKSKASTHRDRAPVASSAMAGFPGRPSMKEWVLARHEQRISAAESLERIGAEAVMLLEWLKREHPGEQQYPTKRTIENIIRNRHRQVHLRA